MPPSIDYLVYKGKVPTSTRRRRGRPPAARTADASRRELLDAAEAEFAARGYRATTVEHVVTRAGLSKGTFYWTFLSKEDLFLALLEERLDAPAKELMTITRDAPAGEPSAGAVSLGLADLFAAERDLILLLHEYWAAAARDAGVAGRYRERQAALRHTLAAALAARHEHTGVPMTMPAEDLAEAFLALAVGLGLDAVVDADAVRPDLFGEIAALVYDGMVLRSGGR